MENPLPQPTESARSVNELTSSIVADILPIGGNTIKALWLNELQRRFERGQKTLVRAISERGIKVLNDEQLKFYVPVTYTFFEKVRIGIGEYSLALLATIIAEGLNPGILDLEQTSRAMDAISGLSEYEMLVLIHSEKHQNRFANENWKEDERRSFISAELLARYEPNHHSNQDRSDQALNVLSQRGLLLGAGMTSIDARGQSFRVGPLGYSALKKAGLFS